MSEAYDSPASSSGASACADVTEGGNGRLQDVLAEYLLAAEAGDAPDRETFVEAHPEFADALRSFFADESQVGAMANRLGAGAIARGGAFASATPAHAHVFGDYELIDEIGRGGMGVVYRARQVHLDRVVALKMILTGRFASDEDVRRFSVEAHNAANLDHPNIVPVYEVGCYSGQHYFSMKLIDGASLSTRRGEFTTDPKASARLMAGVARAVHHAHQRGILHRDLKPGNILIDVEGRPHVTDFGLSHRMADDGRGLTVSGAVLGSPRYMAPEQARGGKGLTVAADVYSLGAVLYELLTGRPPFSADSVVETLRLVREQDPTRPSLLLRGMDRDLETIALKCLEKVPEQRYASAEELAGDLERWLDGEPIRARPTTWLCRTRKWARRKPASAALVGVLILSATMLVGGLAWNNVTVKRERNEKQAALDAEASLRKLAVTTLEFLTDDVVRRQLARRPGLSPEDRAFLRRIAEHYETFVSYGGEDRAVRAAGHFRLGMIREHLGEFREAINSYRRAVGLYADVTSDSPANPDYRNELVGARSQLGRVLSKSDLRDEAGVEFRLAIELGNRLVDDFPDMPLFRRNLAYAHNGLGGLLGKLGRNRDAAGIFRRAIELDERVVTAFPDVPEYREFLANSYNGLGVSHRDMGNFDGAIDLLRHALVLREDLVARFPDYPKFRQTLIASYCNLAGALSGQEAEAAFRRAITLGNALVAEYPAVPTYHTRLANAHDGLSIVLAERGEREEAEAVLRRAIELRRRVGQLTSNTDDNDVRLGGAYCNMADLVRRRHQPAEALEWYATAIETLEHVVQREPLLRNGRRHLSRTLVGRAMAHADLEQYVDAARDLDALVQLNTTSDAGHDATRARVAVARLLLSFTWLEHTLVVRCSALLRDSEPDGWRHLRNRLLPYVSTAGGELGIYRDLEWTRLRPPADGVARKAHWIGDE